MEMHQVRYFLALSETLNFTRAAERCNVAQPTLTAAIKNLEQELGGPLFHRERSRSHLTELGRLVLPHFERIDTSTEAVRADATDFTSLAKASLRLGVMCTIGPSQLIGLIRRLSAEIPALDLNLTEAPGDALVELLMAGELDIAFVGLPHYPERLDAQPLYTERYVIAFAHDHRFEAMNVVPFGELKDEAYLSRVNCEHPQHLDRLGVPRLADTNIRFQSEREDWIQAMISAGMGSAVIPEFMALLPGIATRILIDPEVSRTISLVTVAGRRFSPAAQLFVRHAQRLGTVQHTDGAASSAG